MKINIFKSLLKFAGVIAFPACIAMSSCSEDIDESNLYTFTGQTIEDFLVSNDTAFSSFNYILKRVGYDRILSSYGSGSQEYYTCFAPNNAAVERYLDSLYNDTESDFEHNGMTAPGLEGLNDSLCNDIALFHVLGTEKLTIDMEGVTLRTLLGRTMTSATRLTDGLLVLNDKAAIVSPDNEMVNGVVHVVDNVIPRSNKTVVKELQNDERFSIFYEALERTGLVDELTEQEKILTAEKPAPVDGYYTPTECKVGYTIFAETNEVFAKNGIDGFPALVERAKEWYGKAATGDKREATQGWYDYYRNNNITVSTGDDYENPANVLNMFVRYHILKAAVAKEVLAWDHNMLNGHGYSGDAYDYYETMLPKTLMKIWKVKRSNSAQGIVAGTYINRYVENNTLTDAVPTLESMGSSSMHRVVYEGCKINTGEAIAPLNGYIYPIEDVLLYNAQVPNGVLNERIRIDALTMLPEISSNGFRGMRINELTPLNGGKGAGRIRFPIDFFDNVHVYNGNSTQIDMNVVTSVGGKDYTLYKGDSFQGMGIFDFAIKLPPVPDGLYELRINLDCMPHGTMLQYYLGTDPNDLSSMEAIDIPLDMRLAGGGAADFDAERLVEIGCVNILEEGSDAAADLGLESDRVMRTHKYMRAPLCIVRESDQSMISRYITHQLRRILDTRDFKQQDYWLRLKTVLDDGNLERKFQIDYIEFVPVNVAMNERYLEDVY